MQPEVSLGVAIYDYAPNVVFVLGIYFVIQSVRKQLKKPYYYMMIFAATIILIAGMLKATWKLVIAIAGADIRIFSDVQFPLMGIGFFTIFIILILVLVQKEGLSGSPVAFAAYSKKVFLPMMLLGGTGVTVCLMILSWRRKATLALVFFIVEMAMTLGLGYTGSKFDVTSNYAVFLEQTLNLSSRIVWMMGCYYLYKTSRKIQQA